jgi:NADPH:quinone reductase
MPIMRAVQAIEFGPPDVLVPCELPEPTAGAGQVVVSVEFAPVLFLDIQIRAGWGREWFSVTPPYTPGAGVAGEIASVGQGVDPEWLGRRVVADTAEGGGYLERAAVEASRVVAVPEALGTAEAAALLHDGRTAMGLIDVAAIRPEEWVLVLGAGGGLGILLVQLAHDAGGRVIGAARGKHKLDLAQELGADVVVGYSQPDWPSRCSPLRAEPDRTWSSTA